MLHSRRNGDGQRGQIIVLFELCLVVILACAALVIDLGLLRNNRQTLVNTLDSAALAGGSVLPVDGAAEAAVADALIDANIQANYPGLPTTAYSIAYKCLVGADPNTGAPLISRDVPAMCDPRPSFGLGTTLPPPSKFTGAGLTRVSDCDPTAGDKCNVVLIMGSETTQYSIAPVVGVNSGSTGTVVAAACNGQLCGQTVAAPVDLVIILDRTGSMSGTDSSGNNKITSLKNAAKTVLGLYDPTLQRVALALTGPGAVDASGSPTLNSCPSGGTAYGTADDTNFFPHTTLSGGTTTVSSKATTVSGATTTLNGATTLSAAVANTTTTTITVASKTGFPTTYPFTIKIDSEQMSVTASPTGTTWTVVRGFNSTTKATHTSGKPVYLVISSSATTINVASAAGFPTSGNYTIQIGTEQMLVTAGQGTTTWTVTRAQNGTVAATQLGGSTVSEVVGKTQTTIDVVSAIGFPTSGNYTIKVDSEQMTVTGGQGTGTWTVTRGANGTTTAVHSIGAAISWVLGTNDTTIYVASKAQFPTIFPFTIQVDSEQMSVTADQGTTAWTVTRGANSTTKATHSGGATASLIVSPTDTMIVVNKALGIPVTGSFRIVVDDGVAAEEEMQATVWGTTSSTIVLGVTRGGNGTTGHQHISGASVQNLTSWTPDAATDGVWVPVGLSGIDTTVPLPNPNGAAGTYEIAGTPNTATPIVKSINCITDYSSGTTLAQPLAYAKWYLDTYGRPGVLKGILLETDGHPENGGGGAGYNGRSFDALQFTCGAAITAASAAKAEGIRIYTVGYGINSTNCQSTSTNSAETSPGMTAKTLLQTLATSPTDFYDSPTGSDLSTVFGKIANSLVQSGSHLIQLYPSPVVSLVGTGTSVSITGKYFTGAFSVKFGGLPATVSALTDTSMTATAPSGPASGTVVNVVVTTPGGTSTVTSVSKYTYP